MQRGLDTRSYRESVLRADHIDTPHPARLSPKHPKFAEVMSAHGDAVRAGVPSYRDPVSGLMVFTAAFLAERARCCESGCRHCPYVGAADRH